MPITHLLYLHGFRSSSQSIKAQQVLRYLATNHPDVKVWCPQQAASPQANINMLMQGVTAWPGTHMAVIGSSLGGYYATWIAQQRNCRAVLINPAINPARDLHQYIGEQFCWHDPDLKWQIKPEYMQELLSLHAGSLLNPQLFYALIAKGDEVLDWHEMHERYSKCHVKLLEGSDHAISDFESHLAETMAFIGL